MLGEPRPIMHPVKFYERGTRPLEIVATRQWYIRNGGRDDELRDELLERGKQLTWHPAYMRNRYENWVGGLNGDWLISRQRFFGVPIPVWYRLDDEGNPLYDDVLAPDRGPAADRPVDRLSRRVHRGPARQPGGFIGDPDVMDTWATSSLTPQIAGGWVDDPDLFARVFPMDMRPQAHDIIRTWLFSTVVRSHHEHGCLPWTNAAISGWILDPDRKKMSKSKGNVVTPIDLLEQYGTDAVRYWAASGRPGVDTAFDEGQMKIGRKLATKLLNATKFVLGFGEPPAGASPTGRVDLAMLARLDEVVDEATTAFDEFDYARALERTEAFFWWFCDDYVELVKGRGLRHAGRRRRPSARAALREALRHRPAPVRPVPAVRHRRGVELVAATARCTPSRGRRRALADGGDVLDAGAGQRGAGAVRRGQDRGQAEPAGRRRGAGRSTGRRGAARHRGVPHRPRRGRWNRRVHLADGPNTLTAVQLDPLDGSENRPVACSR